MAIADADRDRVEAMLRSFPHLQTRLRNLRGTVRRFKKKIANEEYSLQAVDYRLISVGKTGRVSQRQEEWVDRHLDRFPDLLRMVNELEQLESEVEEVLTTIKELYVADQVQYRFMVLYYFRNGSMVDVCGELGVSRKRGEEICTKVLEHFLFREAMYGIPEVPEQRQLSREKKMETVKRLAEEVTEDGERKYSTRDIEDITGIPKSTVDRYIDELSQMGQLNLPDRVKGRDGKSRATTKPSGDPPRQGPSL